MKMQESSVESGSTKSHGSNDCMRLDCSPIVVCSSHVSDVAIVPSQKQFPPVLTDRAGSVVVLKPHRPEGFRGDLVQPVGVRTGRRPQVDVERFPVLLVTHRNSRRGRVDVQQFGRNRFRGQWSEIRAVRLNPVQTVFRQKHDRIIHPAPSLRADDADRFRDPLKLPGGRVPLNGPQGATGGHQKRRIPAGNHCGRLRPHVSAEGQLERHSPAFVRDVASVGPVGVNPLPTRVDGVVGAAHKQPVPVNRPEGAVRRNLPLGRGQRRRRARLGISSGDARSRDGVDVLLPRDQEPGGSRHQRGSDPGNARRCDRHHIGDGAVIRRRVLRQARPASAPHPAGQIILSTDIHRPRSGIDLLPGAGLGAQAHPANDALQWEVEVFVRHVTIPSSPGGWLRPSCPA